MRVGHLVDTFHQVRSLKRSHADLGSSVEASDIAWEKPECLFVMGQPLTAISSCPFSLFGLLLLPVFLLLFLLRAGLLGGLGSNLMAMTILEMEYTSYLLSPPSETAAGEKGTPAAGPVSVMEENEEYGPDSVKEENEEYGPVSVKEENEEYGPDSVKEENEEHGPDSVKEETEEHGPDSSTSSPYPCISSTSLKFQCTSLRTHPAATFFPPRVRRHNRTKAKKMENQSLSAAQGISQRESQGHPLAQTTYSHCRGNPTGILETNTEPLSHHSGVRAVLSGGKISCGGPGVPCGHHN
ncbi:hypothetical protein D9C73_011136 [Collichthys lucidus]|uniref:Uncharacterized protein n=1 Tax=Collichthys lucidus TaxID=240159 RepID=A0A4U5UTR8_COLLU|nr:hypothetical protein D9C73_011136 [Collichthys lucidus]